MKKVLFTEESISLSSIDIVFACSRRCPEALRQAHATPDDRLQDLQTCYRYDIIECYAVHLHRDIDRSRFAKLKFDTVCGRHWIRIIRVGIKYYFGVGVGGDKLEIDNDIVASPMGMRYISFPSPSLAGTNYQFSIVLLICIPDEEK
jgi:hypothetical protein